MVPSRHDQEVATIEEQWVMLQMGLVEVIQSEREREIEEAIRRRQLLKPQDETEQQPPSSRSEARTMAVRARPTEG